MIAYLDAQAAIWLAGANTILARNPPHVGPLPQDVVYKLGAELEVTVCDYPLPIIAEIAIGETWTRDPFDRLIVAHAKANGQPR